MKGNIDESIKWYIKSWKSQDMWPQFHHLCFWELMWTNRYENDLLTASLPFFKYPAIIMNKKYPISIGLEMLLYKVTVDTNQGYSAPPSLKCEFLD
jgi:hypothetical protein